MSSPHGLDEVLADVAAAMRDVGARWYLFGAQAASLWGRPRLTADIDVTIEIPDDGRDAFLQAMTRQVDASPPRTGSGTERPAGRS